MSDPVSVWMAAKGYPARNVEMAKMRETGATYKAVSLAFGLSVERTRQIIAGAEYRRSREEQNKAKT